MRIGKKTGIRLIIILWSLWIMIFLTAVLMNYTRITEILFPIPFIAVVLFLVIRQPLKIIKRLIMIFYGYHGGFGAVWWISLLSVWFVIALLKCAAEYPNGIPGEAIIRSVTSINALTVIGVIIFLSPAVIWPLGRKFVERLIDDGSFGAMVAVNDKGDVVDFGGSLWRESGCVYKKLPVYLDEQKVVSINKSNDNLSLVISFQISIESAVTEKNVSYYNALHHAMPESGFMNYFEELLKKHFSEKEDEIASSVLNRSEISTGIEKKIMTCFRLTNPFSEIIKVTLTLKNLEVSVMNKEAKYVLLPS